MNNLSPLRYPGGKSKLEPFIKFILENKLDKSIDTYIEPFAGGAGVALSLLLSGTVNNIIINDYDKAIYSIWKAILTETQRFIETIINTEITITEWEKQKKIYNTKRNKYSFELGFATFFLNRTNRSGIISAGPIGGYSQNGNYCIDARFNKESLIYKIQEIAKYKNHIKLYNKDIKRFIKLVINQSKQNSFVYFDPPYYIKGKELYKNYFKHNDHQKILECIETYVRCPWIITYDDVYEIEQIYKTHYIKRYDLNYSLANKGKASEIIIFSDENICPKNEELENSNTRIRVY